MIFALVGSGEPVQPLNPRKTVSKVDDLSSMFTMTSYSLFWSALSGRRGWTLRDWSGACGREFQHSKYKFSSHPKIMELTGKCGIIRIMSYDYDHRQRDTVRNQILGSVISDIRIFICFGLDHIIRNPMRKIPVASCT